jgi:hypothetical protein
LTVASTSRSPWAIFVEGTVIRRGKRDEFVAVVRFLGRGATVDLEDWQVEQIIEG